MTPPLLLTMTCSAKHDTYDGKLGDNKQTCNLSFKMRFEFV